MGHINRLTRVERTTLKFKQIHTNTRERLLEELPIHSWSIGRIEMKSGWLFNKWNICRRAVQVLFYTHCFHFSNSQRTSSIQNALVNLLWRAVFPVETLELQRRDQSSVWHLRGGLSQFAIPQCSQLEPNLSNSHANPSTKCFAKASLFITNI